MSVVTSYADSKVRTEGNFFILEGRGPLELFDKGQLVLLSPCANVQYNVTYFPQSSIEWGFDAL